MHNFFFVVVGVISISFICNFLRRRLKLQLRRVKIVRCHIKYKCDVRHASLGRMLILVRCVNPKQLRMIIDN